MERPGPGAASTWDPELGRRIEGIQRPGGPDPWVTRIVGAVNEHAIAGREPYTTVANFLQHKIRSTAPEVNQFVTNLSSAVNSWTWSGGYDTALGRAARDYIKGETPARAVRGYDDTNLRWAQAIVESIRNAPEMRGVLRRGLVFHVPWDETSPDVPSVFVDAKRGDVFRLDSPQSFTTQAAVAKRFGRSVQLVIQPRYKGLHIRTKDFSEDEVVTYGRFRVEANTVDREGSRVIVLRQLETH